MRRMPVLAGLSRNLKFPLRQYDTHTDATATRFPHHRGDGD